MLAKNHVLWGPIVYASAALAEQSLPLTPLAFLIAMLGALLPDIDHPKSFVGRRFKVVSIPLSNLFGHRGITHSLFVIILLLYWLAESFYTIHYLWVAAILGYLSHVLADFMTKSGVPLLWPGKKRFSAGLFAFKTGDPIEFLLTWSVGAWVGYTALPFIQWVAW